MSGSSTSEKATSQTKTVETARIMNKRLAGTEQGQDRGQGQLYEPTSTPVGRGLEDDHQTTGTTLLAL